MIGYFLLLLPVALAAYFFGSMDTMAIASNFVFHENLMRLGKGNIRIANFRRIYGIPGAIKLLLTELVRDLLPILFGGLVLGFKGHAPVGFVFASFCLVIGRLYPMFYNLRGSSACICMIVGAMFVKPSAGAAVLVVALIVIIATRYVSLGTVAGALAYIPVAVLMADDAIIRKLAIFTAAAVVFKHIPAMLRIMAGREEKVRFVEDITYKFDEKF